MFNKKNMKPILRYIDISKLKVDLKNPRYNDKKIINNIKKWTHQELEKIIEEEDIKDIKNSIQIDGIRDPLWVVKDGEEDEFIVIEGNRRLVTLHTLIKEGVSSPTGKKFESVPCNILSSELSESEINKQRILLQGGKKKWSAFNVASAIKVLVEIDKFNIREIADMMHKSTSFIEKEIKNFEIYKTYAEYRKDNDLNEDVDKYTYFQRAGKSIREIFFEDKNRNEEFFDIITERDNQKSRIPNVALRGGLMKFNKVADYPEILEKFLREKKMTVEQALDLVEEKDIDERIPWLKDIEKISEECNNMNQEDIEMIKNDKTKMKSLKNLSEIYYKIENDYDN
jgi:hypothetical protein